ncbi:hypothetical protein ASD11_01230 [Aeromicrobium sp. Root495]|uniref:hypothetical protein n=1 Tax=Aeromicrobium sp. Root495 TaxID=1736550 RepID=UPI0006FCE5B5|nr:hypothetical protein [Aeromicrobium sp. Root495]KQY58318.1 hypothetical protein ASD11_01230 [Aeromicrobium sp. Root495]
MSILSSTQQTITLLTAATTSDHGREVADWKKPPAAEDDVTGCSFQPGPGQADDENRTGSSATARVFLPAGTQVTARQHVRGPDGLDYKILGEPERHEYGLRSDHVLLRLERWHG